MLSALGSSRLLAQSEYCWIGVTTKSYDPVVGKYASPVCAIVDRGSNIFFRSMPMHRNPVAYLLRVAAAPKGLNFGKMRDSTIVCVLRTIRHDNGHTRRAKKLELHSNCSSCGIYSIIGSISQERVCDHRARNIAAASSVYRLDGFVHSDPSLLCSYLV